MLKSHEGQKVPNVTFPIRVNDEWQKVNSDAVFKGKTVVLFALPGAFTPTCSSRHLPRFNELADILKANGVDWSRTRKVLAGLLGADGAKSGRNFMM